MGTFGQPRRRRGGGGGLSGEGNCRGHEWDAAGGPLRPIRAHHESGRSKPDYETAALCKQVGRVVAMTLSGECGDPALQALIVEEVLPAPNAGRLLVRVLLRPGGPGVIDVLGRLAGVQGLLRARVGEAIARKRTPELAFDVIPCHPAPAQPPSDQGDPPPADVDESAVSHD